MSQRRTHTIILATLLIALLPSCQGVGDKIDPGVSDEHFYSRWGGAVIYGEDCLGRGCIEISGADAATFRPFNRFYATDSKRAYFESRAIDDEGSNGFRALGGLYALGSKGAYFAGELFHVRDLETFSVVEFRIDGRTQHYAKDKAAVYCRNKLMSDDSVHFRAFSTQTYFVDTKDVYFISGGICTALGADPSTFQFLPKKDGADSVYAKDTRHVFYKFTNRKIEGADPATFKVLCSGTGPPHFALDQNQVYQMEKTIPGASPATYVFPIECQ